MDTLFPFGFPFATGFYLALYVLTLVLHVAFMNYVLAGSAWLGVRSLVARRGTERGPLESLLREWLPFMLSLAITAGVAPLLFLQILYQKEFYTANLLLFHRWMAILPVLIVGFYLLYLLKGHWLDQRPRAVRWLAAWGTFACFGFIGWSWTENHLLSINAGDWTSTYVSPDILYHHPELFPRLSLWFFGAFPTLAVWLGWQLWYPHRGESAPVIAGSRRVQWLALGGLAVSVISAGLYWAFMNQPARDTVTSSLNLPWVIVGGVGFVLELVAWVQLFRTNSLTKQLLLLATAGRLLSVTGGTVTREAIRLSAVDITALYPQHQHAIEIGGFGIFVLFLLVNGAIIGWIIWAVQKQLREPEAETGGR